MGGLVAMSRWRLSVFCNRLYYHSRSHDDGSHQYHQYHHHHHHHHRNHHPTSYIIHNASVFSQLLEYPYSIMILTSDIFSEEYHWQRSFEAAPCQSHHCYFLSYPRICRSNQWNRYEQLYWVYGIQLISIDFDFPFHFQG